MPERTTVVLAEPEEASEALLTVLADRDSRYAAVFGYVWYGRWYVSRAQRHRSAMTMAIDHDHLHPDMPSVQLMGFGSCSKGPHRTQGCANSSGVQYVEIGSLLRVNLSSSIC